MNQSNDELDVVICFVIVYCSGVVTTTRIEYFVSKNNENPMTNFIRSLNLSNKFIACIIIPIDVEVWRTKFFNYSIRSRHLILIVQ